ncbi:MAG TPA: hypothetical protein VNQ77_01750 [Frankiaceae bacterium]|nr:hypothetical protein [Frankiaceae bacterium]
MSVAATLSEHLVEPVPGSETTVSVRVLNDGDVVDELDLDVVGEPAGWARVVPGRLLLMPGDSGVANVVFAPPRGPAVPAGVRRFGVRVRSREDTTSATVEEGTAIVAPFADVALGVRPGLRRRRGPAAYDLDVVNAGNAPADVRLAAADDEDVLRYAFSAAAITVAPGERAGVRLRVRPRRRLLLGLPRARVVTVTASYDGEVPATASVVYLQRPYVAAWAVRLALLAVVLLTLLAALLVTLAGGLDAVFPRARTSARQSTAAELAAAKDAAAVQRAAARAQREAADAAAAQLDLAKKQASPAPGPLTTPYGTSLTIPAPRADGETGSASLPRGDTGWPEGSGLALTDLVLMNRDGDSVDVRVLRSGVLLFSLHADTPDARPLALGSPLVLAATDELTVEVTCVATAVTRTPQECVPVVYAGGFLTGPA